MKKFECKHCRERFRSEESLEQHTSAKHGQAGKRKLAIKKSHYVFAGILLAIGLISIWALDSAASPGRYNDFAKCLSDKGAVMYGTDWCGKCQEQKGLFGKSFGHIDYKDCDTYKALCNTAGVSSYPQWIINGTRYRWVQSLASLASYTGCSLE